MTFTCTVLARVTKRVSSRLGHSSLSLNAAYCDNLAWPTVEATTREPATKSGSEEACAHTASTRTRHTTNFMHEDAELLSLCVLPVVQRCLR